MFDLQIRAIELQQSADFALLTKLVRYWKKVYGVMDWELWFVFFRGFLLGGEVVFGEDPPI